MRFLEASMIILRDTPLNILPAVCLFTVFYLQYDKVSILFPAVDGAGIPFASYL